MEKHRVVRHGERGGREREERRASAAMRRFMVTPLVERLMPFKSLRPPV